MRVPGAYQDAVSLYGRGEVVIGPSRFPGVGGHSFPLVARVQPQHQQILKRKHRQARKPFHCERDQPSRVTGGPTVF